MKKSLIIIPILILVFSTFSSAGILFDDDILNLIPSPFSLFTGQAFKLSSYKIDTKLPILPVETEIAMTKSIPITYGLNDTTYGFAGKITDSSLPCLLDSQMDIDIGAVSGTYGFHEEIRLGDDTKTSVETGLTYTENQDPDFKEKVFIPLRKESIGYFFVFDQSLRTGNYITDSTISEPVYLDFLGKVLEIQCNSKCTSSSIIALTGEKHRLKTDESVVISGKIVTLKGCAPGKASIDVDGVTDVINENSQMTINGIRVRVESVFDEEGITNDEATIIMGNDVIKTYRNGDPYIGEYLSSPMWVWQLASLDTNNPDIGVWFDLSIDDPSETDNPAIQHPLYEGEYVCLPNNYACLTFDSLKQSDSEFLDIIIGTGTADMYTNDEDAVADYTAKGIYFKASGTDDEGLSAAGKDTEEVFLYKNSTHMNAYRKSTSTNKLIYAANIAQDSSTTSLFRIVWKSSRINVGYESGSGTTFNILIIPDASSITKITFSNPTTMSSLYWNSTTTSTDISSRTENAREKYGMIISTPEQNLNSNKVKLRIPPDINNYKANIKLSCGKKAEPELCTETDGGFNIYKKGTTTFGGETKSEFCKTADSLYEFYCKLYNGKYELASKVTQCPLEHVCKDGACIKAIELCNGIDDDKNGLVDDGSDNTLCPNGGACDKFRHTCCSTYGCSNVEGQAITAEEEKETSPAAEPKQEQGGFFRRLLLLFGR